MPRPTLLEQSTPIVATYQLRNADGSTSHWVLKAAAGGTSPVIESLDVSAQLCLEQFGRFLDSDGAGGLGGAYCVVDGTGGDKVGREGMSGEGMVCMLDAKVEVGGLGASRYGVLAFMGYRRGGT
ncbi:hypothetical protein BDU57DRAFT_523449 [Ampelomyces quisqualis]|uniref:Uncharacterized protein n=1 Tax=Ampelomyces quisqualis TaxID=50730 RepID=A0A6A5Q9J6_AMPQU|nr:hypothetical protein BDU57DRAFT_523449 [Ampelomyces quisqualis]